MVLYPEVQVKAQAEIDTVIGSTRFPCFEDRPSLPYIEAILRELPRWNPTLPLGMHHCTMCSFVKSDHFSDPARYIKGRYIRWLFYTERFVCIMRSDSTTISLFWQVQAW